MPADEGRGLERCRRALARGRRVRGRTIAASERDGLLLDLGGVLGHAPPSEVAAGQPRPSIWGRPRESRWEGWVAAVAGDLVHLVGRRPGEGADGDPVRGAEVVSSGRDGVVVRLDDGTRGFVPWEELSWQPALEPPALDRGTRVTGRIVGLTLDGPVLSPRAVAPTPWPAIALALPPGTTVGVHVEACAAGHALLRTARAPRAAALVPADTLPGGAQVGDAIEARVERVSPIAGALVLDELSPSLRAPRRAPAAPRQGRPGPGRAA